MASQECRMIQVKAAKGGDVFPIAIAIVIAPSQAEAEKHGKQELEPYTPDYPVRLLYTDLGPILFPPVPTIVFLYTQKGGRIK